MTFKTERGSIHCASCEDRISSALARMSGVTGVRASSRTQEIQVRFDSTQLSAAEVEAKLAEIGFPAKRAR